MKVPRSPHRWTVSPRRAIAIQRELADKVIAAGSPSEVRLVAGTDLAFSRDRTQCIAGAVVWDLSSSKMIEQHVVRRPVRFPYVPGLLSFREAPAILAVIRRLRSVPDVFMFDGQGYAHPRRFGLACHVGVILDRPALGCAKSLLVGTTQMPGRASGSTSVITHNGETIGMCVRSRDRVKPVFVSVGHRLSLQAAVRITLMCCGRYRLPEPTRLADRLVARERSKA